MITIEDGEHRLTVTTKLMYRDDLIACGEWAERFGLSLYRSVSSQPYLSPARTFRMIAGAGSGSLTVKIPLNSLGLMFAARWCKPIFDGVL